MADTLPPPVWVDRQSQLQHIVADLSSQPRLAVDTESNSLHAFRERVCLIQFSTPKVDYLIDPIALADHLACLGPIFANSQIEKIFHASEYDLICLTRDFGFRFSNLFDTMHAARILGYRAVGLDRLLGDKFGIQMDKRHQKANWGARPLKPEQIHYARLDTHYLFQLRDVMEQELRSVGRWELAQEDFARACEVEESRYASLNGSYKRFSSRKDLSARELTIISELCVTRDSIAQKLDRPTFKVIGDDMLIAIARRQPEQKVDLSGIGMSEKQIRFWGEEILAAVRRGLHAPPVKREQAKPQNDAVLKRLEKLKNWRKKVALEIDVESDVVLPKPYLASLAETPPTSMGDLEKVMGTSPSRVQKYGSQILKLLGG